MSCLLDSNSIDDHHLKSIVRVNSYPMVSDSLIVALSYYQWIKSKNSVLDSSLSMIENTLKSVKDKTEPFAAEKLKFLDDTVCNQLERLERICPIILEPSPQITSIHRGIEQSMKAVIWPMTKTVDVVSKTSSATLSTMSSVLGSSLKLVMPVSASVNKTTHTVLDRTDDIMNRILPDEKSRDEGYDEGSEIAEAGVYTKVKRLSIKTQRRLYRKAIAEINALQKASVAKLTLLHSLMHEIHDKTAPDNDRIVEGCESTAEPMVNVAPVSAQPGLVKQASSQIEQLQDIMAAVASIKKYATTNTLISLHFINSNLSLFKTALIVNEKILHQSIKVIEKIQFAIEYIMGKIKVYIKSQRLEEAKYGLRRSKFILDDSDIE